MPNSAAGKAAVAMRLTETQTGSGRENPDKLTAKPSEIPTIKAFRNMAFRTVGTIIIGDFPRARMISIVVIPSP